MKLLVMYVHAAGRRAMVHILYNMNIDELILKL